MNTVNDGFDSIVPPEVADAVMSATNLAYEAGRRQRNKDGYLLGFKQGYRAGYEASIEAVVSLTVGLKHAIVVPSMPIPTTDDNPEDELSNITIQKLDLSDAISIALDRYGVHSLAELLSLGKKSFLQIGRAVGESQTRLEEIITKLESYGRLAG